MNIANQSQIYNWGKKKGMRFTQMSLKPNFEKERDNYAAAYKEIFSKKLNINQTH